MLSFVLGKLLGRLPEDSLVTESRAGLGGRMTGLQDAIMLGREFGKQVYLGWAENDECGCRFEDIFERTDGTFRLLKYPARDFREVYRPLPRLVAKLNGRLGLWLSRVWMAILLRYRYRFEAYLGNGSDYRVVPSVLKTNSRVFTSRGFDGFYRRIHPDAPGARFEYLRPAADLRRRIDEIVSQFGANTVGIHIRWGDSGWEMRSRSPVSAFVRAMREEVRRDPGVRFYLATESDRIAARLRVLFGDRILTQPDVVLERDNAAGMKSAVVDMWALSRTQKIIGGFRSGFSGPAASMGQIEIHRLDEQSSSTQIWRPARPAGGSC